MRNITCFILLTLLLCGFDLRANTADIWSQERCAQLRQRSQSDSASLQQLQQHCTETVATPANVMPVQLDVQMAKPATAAETPVSAPVQRVQHNSTLETLGSAMLLVLVGFWLWMGRK